MEFTRQNWYVRAQGRGGRGPLTSELLPGEVASLSTAACPLQVQQERDELYRKFTAAILEVQQKVGFKNLVLERKLQALSAAVEKKEVQVNEVLAASNLDPAALTLVSRKLEVGPRRAPGEVPGWSLMSLPPSRCPELGLGVARFVCLRPASVIPVGTLRWCWEGHGFPAA